MPQFGNLRLILCSLSLTWSFLHTPSLAQDKLIRIDSETQPADVWKKVNVIGDNASLEILEESDNHFIRTTCGEKSESGFIYSPIKIDIKPGTLLRWKWRLVRADWDIPDFSTDWPHHPARIYIYFGHDPLKEGGYALSYMWSIGLSVAKWDHSKNPYPHRYLTIENGIDKKGQWIQEERNLYQDFMSAQGTSAPEASGIGLIIAQTGQGGNATFDYDDIEIVTNGRSHGR